MIHNHIVIICKKKNNKCRRVSGEGSAELKKENMKKKITNAGG
jgi:hypothetical protein